MPIATLDLIFLFLASRSPSDDFPAMNLLGKIIFDWSPGEKVARQPDSFISVISRFDYPICVRTAITIL